MLKKTVLLGALFMAGVSGVVETRQEPENMDYCSQAHGFEEVMAHGIKHSKKGEYHKALPCFERGAKLRPDNAGTVMYYGESLMRTGRLDEAIAALEKTSKLMPKNPLAFLLLATTAQRKRDSARAKYAPLPLKFFKFYRCSSYM